MTIRSYQYTVQLLITASQLNFSVEHALGLVDEASDGVRRVVSDELVFVENADAFALPSGTIQLTDDLGLVQTVKVFGYESVDQELALTQETEAIFPIVRNFTHNNILFDTVEYGYKVRTFDITDELNLVSDAGIARTFSINQGLSLSSIAFRSFTPSSDLNLIQTVEWGYGIDVFDDLNLVQTADNDLVLNQPVNQDNVVRQALTFYIESPCARYTFNTFHGEGGVEPLAAKLNYKSQFALYSIDNGTTFQLRNPETDDRRRYNYNRVNRDFLDGSPDIFTDDDWVEDQSQIYTIVATKRADLETLQTFLIDNLGREVVLKDWKGVSWIVIITNPGEIYTEDSEGYWTIVFETTGEAVDGELYYDRLGLAEDLSRAGSIWTRSGSDDLGLESRANRHYDEELSDVSIVSDGVSEVVETP